jgi:hypothetical protein
LIATVKVFGPFQVLTRPLTLKPRERKPPVLGPQVSVAAVHLSPAANESGLTTLIDGSGLKDRDQDGLLEHDTNLKNMWSTDCTTNLCLEFEFADAVPLAAIEVWNFNGFWQTTNGIRRADVAVSSDGSTWQTVLRGAEFTEAEGNADYDEPTVLKFGAVTARKVRLENIVPASNSGRVGLSEVVFHRSSPPTMSAQP